MTQKIAIIHQYSDAKDKQKTAIACIKAWQIVTSDHLKRMARHQLVLSESAIRQDALKFATMKLLKSLDDDEQKKVLTVKAYIEACSDTQKAWKSIHQGHRNALQREKAWGKAEIRDALAFKMVEHIEEYRPYLHHFSIGKLNRLGVSQYRIEKGEERAADRLKNLSIHAEKHQMACAVASIFSKEPLETKEQLASLLKNQSKAVHPHLIRLSEKTKKPLDELWREINQRAKSYEENHFKKSLNAQEKICFDTIKTYQSLNKELAIHFASTIYALEKGNEIPETIKQAQSKAAILRNQIATTVHNNDSFDKILHFFKIDNIKQQSANHDKRETVMRFKQATSNFEQKKETALIIASDIKGHYPFIKEFGINTKILTTLMRIEERRIFIGELNQTQKDDFFKCMDYKITDQKASHLWKAIFSDKEQGLPLNQQKLIQVQQLMAKRDGFAYVLHQTSDIQGLLVREKLDPIKIEQHARQHKARLQTVHQLNETKANLFHQLEHRIESMNHKESTQWHKAWAAFKNDLQRVSKNQSLYQEAIETIQKSPLIVTKNETSLLSQYDLDNKASILDEIVDKAQLESKGFYDASKITEALIANSIETYRTIFGEPKKITSREMRYSGGLIISLKGRKAGSWYNFSEGCGGNPLSALMKERGISFQDALKEGAIIAGISGCVLPMKREKKLHDLCELREEKNKIISAKSILKGGMPISGTLAETYLKEHRGIEHPEQLNILYWPKGALWKAIDDNGALYEKINKIPALLIAAKNKQGEITGVQRIYLDEKNATKNTFMENAKLSKGRIEGSAGVLQTGGKHATLYLAEGPETGATIAMANPKATVLVSFGLSNLKNLGKLIKSFYPSEVIIAGDNDFSSKNSTAKITEAAKEILMKEGIDVTIITPQSLAGREKTDWNDVHCSKGLQQVKQQLGLNEINPGIHKIAVRLNNEKSLELEQYVNNFVVIKNQFGKAIPKNYNVDYLNGNKANEPYQRSFDIDRTKEFQRNQKEMDIEL